MLHIFISYSKNDTKDLAVELADALATIENITVWFDRSLKIGSDFQIQIEQQIDLCNFMIILCSQDIHRHKLGGDQSYVLKEINYAQSLGKSILPVTINKTNLPLSLSGLQSIEYSLEDSGLDELVRNLCSTIGISELATVSSQYMRLSVFEILELIDAYIGKNQFVQAHRLIQYLDTHRQTEDYQEKLYKLRQQLGRWRYIATKLKLTIDIEVSKSLKEILDDNPQKWFEHTSDLLAQLENTDLSSYSARDYKAYNELFSVKKRKVDDYKVFKDYETRVMKLWEEANNTDISPLTMINLFKEARFLMREAVFRHPSNEYLLELSNEADKRYELKSQEEEMMTSAILLGEYETVLKYLHNLSEDDKLMVFDLSGRPFKKIPKDEAIKYIEKLICEEAQEKVDIYMHSARKQLSENNPIVALTSLKQFDKYWRIEYYLKYERIISDNNRKCFEELEQKISDKLSEINK